MILSKVSITFPDNSRNEFEQGTTPSEVASSISNSLRKKAIAALFNEKVISLDTPLQEPGLLHILTFNDSKGKEVFWHSSAHLMAQAIKRLYPEAQLGIGPPINDGFYYDIDLEHKFSPEDLEKIESEMAKIVDENLAISGSVMDKEDALKFFKNKNEYYKIELIEELNEVITAYSQGEFTDLCRGPHVTSTGVLGKNFKLLSLAGAYWRGNEHNKQLQRIYGTNYPDKKDLKEHLFRIEEAKKRDHRKLGKELELFMFAENVGSGIPIWLPKGTIIREQLIKYMQDAQVKSGYQQVVTPHIGKKELYVKSGHYEKYGSDSFKPINTPREGEEFLLKPMNCPHHCEIYKFKPRSYRDLPLRIAEFGTVYRYEQSGELNGLTRVRGFTQDDAHIFCRPDQIKKEFIDVIDLVFMVFKKLGFEKFTAQISLRDQHDRSKYIGSDENWERAENDIIEAAKEKGLNTITEYGEAAFYGPKLDFIVQDALGRPWQLGTIQVDYNLPERFELEYIGSDGQKHRPVMIHRAPFGSIERFFAILTEHCAGNFPLWLAPQQIILLPIADRHEKYTEEVSKRLKDSGLRVDIDNRNEKIGYKIREAEVQKIPYMVIIGDKEVEENSLSVRHKGEGDLGKLKLKDFIDRLASELQNS
ncbi:MAG: threonine--tRNA ligase [Calditrichae bacterium]|nr:threonine--tRNA ligase [Calditrichia bacterium]